MDTNKTDTSTTSTTPDTTTTSTDTDTRPETARLNQGRHIVNGIDVKVAEKIQDIQQAFDLEFFYIDDSGANIANKLHPIVTSEAQVSRIRSASTQINSTPKDVRHVNIRILAAMRYVYGTDVNKVIDDWIVGT